MADSNQSNAPPSVASLRFDTIGWTYLGERAEDHVRIWKTPDHDAVSLHFFGIPPDLPQGSTVEEFREFYSGAVRGSNAALVDCAVSDFAGQNAIILILKVTQKPSGLMYQAAVTVPFRDFSFVVKVQCLEHGPTGLREAVLLDRRLKSGERPSVVAGNPPFPNWNPDSPDHDAEFYMHPVSRVRRILKSIVSTASLDEAVGKLPFSEIPRNEIKGPRPLTK